LLYEVTSTQPSVDGPRLIKAFVAKVVREKSQPAQADPYVRLFEAELKNGSTFEESLLTAYTAVLCSPANLYFHEQPGRLDAFAQPHDAGKGIQHAETALPVQRSDQQPAIVGA
jgi:hypothetical protein